jgi:hypothetical protein
MHLRFVEATIPPILEKLWWNWKEVGRTAITQDELARGASSRSIVNTFGCEGFPPRCKPSSPGVRGIGGIWNGGDPVDFHDSRGSLIQLFAKYLKRTDFPRICAERI